MRYVTSPRAERTAWVDVCASLLEVCGAVQRDMLDPRGITCLFDVDSGTISAWRCNILGRIVRELVGDICAQAELDHKGGRITVALHHKSHTWVLAVADEGVRTLHRNVPVHATERVMGLARPLKGTCRSRLTPRGAVTALLFTVKQPWCSEDTGRDRVGGSSSAERDAGLIRPTTRSLPRRVPAYH